MKRILMLVVAGIVVLAQTGWAQEAKGAKEPVKYFAAKEVEAAMSKSPPTITKGEGYTVMMNRRTKGGEAELHDADSDVFYIVDGSATFITGGTLVGGKTTAPGETRAPSIRNGKAHKLSKGDVITIPRGVPHWFSEVPQSVTYFIVKIIK